MKKITKEDLESGYSFYLTVGRLEEFIKKSNLPKDSKVLIQRIEDEYYENQGWGVYLKKDINSYPDDNGITEEDSMSQYHPAFCCVKYKDEDKILFINLHY